MWSERSERPRGARKVEIQGGHSVVERVTPYGYEVVKTRLPSLIVATKEVGEMRYPTVVQRREAKKKPVVVWKSSDVGLKGEWPNRLILKRLFSPEMRKGQCTIIEGETPREAGRNLAQRLRNAGVI